VPKRKVVVLLRSSGLTQANGGPRPESTGEEKATSRRVKSNFEAGLIPEDIYSKKVQEVLNLKLEKGQ